MFVREHSACQVPLASRIGFEDDPINKTVISLETKLSKQILTADPTVRFKTIKPVAIHQRFLELWVMYLTKCIGAEFCNLCGDNVYIINR